MIGILKRMFGKAAKGPEPDRAIEVELYNAVGVAALDNVGRKDVSVLLYVELVEGGLDHCLRYSETDSPHFASVMTDGNLGTTLWQLYNFVIAQDPEKRWSKMEYFIEDGEIDVSFSFDPVDEDIPFWERNPVIIEKYFPGRTSVNG
ncbi:hypothetical protein [Altererythrobacter sp. MF3-039]|uniref:hypothetical protein n=1 Tax=Altererythrobacter sp. MF3-039 TaxID=3252901 RepID=UPI00390C5E82